MRVKFILPALAEARAEYYRRIKYSLFPPLGLATLAAYLDDGDDASIVDEHVETLDCSDAPDLVAIETYVTSARRAYEIADIYRARGSYVVMGGLHVTALPDEALAHADTIVTGPAEEAWPRFLADFRARRAARVYRSSKRTLAGAPSPRRDLINRRNYLAPNSMVVSRGCPHSCDFCYKSSFYAGGPSFYTCNPEAALTEIEAMPGRHLFFLDDNIFADPPFAAALFAGMRGMGRVWQGAATVQSILNSGLLDAAVACGMRSLFVGFESLSQDGMLRHGKRHNNVGDYSRAIRALHERGVMINGSFIFGLDSDDENVFDTTTDWAVANGIETSTFHILTPYPGTPLFERLSSQERILHRNWEHYDTRHAVFKHPSMSRETIEKGYWRSYKRFYNWPNILKSAAAEPSLLRAARHVAYTGAWKKLDPLWTVLVKCGLLGLAMRPLEYTLRGRQATGSHPSQPSTAHQPIPT